MSSVTLTIAKDEWRYWWRSKLAISVLIIAIALAIAAVIVTALSVSHSAQQREHLQHSAEQAFASQPNRHPHRMVHYGHYVFRIPPPLAGIDPGIDALTGTSIFLEGHRQNGASFSEQQQGTGLTWLGGLSVAFVMQVLAPLLLIIMGYGAITREREAGTFDFLKAQGVSPLSLIVGKGLALLLAGLLVLTPLALGSIYAAATGGSAFTTGFFILAYALYLGIWCSAVLLVSTLCSSNSISFSVLIGLWILLCLLLPRIASNSATVLVSSPGKLETDFAVIDEVRKLGDGHNASDPAFQKLKANLLAQYNVDNIEDLPINFRGVVAQQSEQNLTQVLNKFAEQSMHEAIAQAQIARQFGWLSPMIAIRSASMTLAGTDLENYHRFLREAEDVRYQFVQSLNKLHAEALSHKDDSNKYLDEANLEKAKVDASNWQMLSEFTFSPAPANQRIAHSLLAFSQLILLLILFLVLLRFAGQKQ